MADQLKKRNFLNNYMNMFNNNEDLLLKKKYLHHIKSFFIRYNIPLKK